jgi:peptide/nickel transport system permease protein
VSTYVVRRVAQLVPVLLVVSLALFLLLRVLPGDPTTAVLGEEATEEQRAALRAEFGLDRPLVEQYLAYAADLLRGDLGESWTTGEPVGEIVLDRLATTAELGLLGMAFAVLVGLPLGVLAALRRRGRLDGAVNALAVTALATPNFAVAAVLILVFAVQLGWAPASGFVPFTRDPVANLQYMVLPTLTVGLSIAAVAFRQSRSAMIGSLGEEFVRTARSVGLAERRIVLSYALRHALIPVVTVLSLQLGALVSASVVTETIFALPGMGSLVVRSIFARDLPVVQGAVLVVVVLVLLINLLTDLVYARLDPRIVY